MVSQAPLVDTHCHLGFEAFDKDRPEVLERARAAGLVACVAVAVDAASAGVAAALAVSHPGFIHPTAGIHPTEDCCGDEAEWEHVEALIGSGEYVAVGETGLDAFHDRVPMPTQIDSLERHLGLAIETRLPVILHCRDAFEPLTEVVNRFAGSGLHGVLHCFTGSIRELAPLVAAGLHIGFGGITTFKPREDLREAAREVPLDRLLIETDAPWLAPVPHRGRRNEPAYVAATAQCIAEERGLDLATLARATTSNARALFGLPGTP